MKSRITFRDRQPALSQNIRVVEVDRGIEAAACRIVVDHLHELADRTGLQPIAVRKVPGQLDRQLLRSQALQFRCVKGIE